MNRGILGALALSVLSAGACNDKRVTDLTAPGVQVATSNISDGSDVATKWKAASPRPIKFNLIARVVGAGTGGVAQSQALHPLAGASVTMILLPLREGDAPSRIAEPYLEPDTVGTVVTDSSGLVRFYNIDVTRYRIEVKPPAGAAWIGTTVDNPPPVDADIEWNARLTGPVHKYGVEPRASSRPVGKARD